MQRETPLTASDLTLLTEGPNDALALAERLIEPNNLVGY